MACGNRKKSGDNTCRQNMLFCHLLFPYFAINSSSIFSADWYPAVAM